MAQATGALKPLSHQRERNHLRSASGLCRSAAFAAGFESIIDQCHGQTPALLVRTLDGIHLASATVSPESGVVATDRLLREAALALGFRVYPPDLTK